MKLRGVKSVTDEEYLFQNGWFKEPARDGRHWWSKETGAGRYDFQAALKIQKGLDRAKEARIATKTGQG
jgi:hypothetical protein